MKATVVAVSLLVIASMLDTSAVSGQEAWNPPEHYEKVWKQRETRIAEMRSTIDLQSIPRFRTVIAHTDRYIVVEKETWSLFFNRQNGVLDKVKLLDVIADRHCLMPDLKVMDISGTTYYQHNCRSARILVDDSKFHLLIDFLFSPVSNNGEKLPGLFKVHYDVFKMSGMVTVRYSVEEAPDVKVKLLQINNTIGRTVSKMDLFNCAHSFDNGGKIALFNQGQVTDSRDRFLYSGKATFATWTDGRIGFSVYPRRYTWDQMEFDNPANDGNRVRIEIIDGSPCVNILFIDIQKGVSLEEHRNFDLGLAFLPFRKLRPTIGAIDFSQVARVTPWSIASEAHFRDYAYRGVQQVICNISHGPSFFYGYSSGEYHEQAQRCVNIAHKYGIDILGVGVVNQRRVTRDFPPVDKVLPDGLLEKIDSEPWAKETWSFETPEVREAFLDERCSSMMLHNLDGYYEDLHAGAVSGPDWTSQVEGNVRYLEDMYLLLKSFGSEKVLVTHSVPWYTVAESMADAICAGEQWNGVMKKGMEREWADMLYNPLLLGADVMGYTGGCPSYDYRSILLIKQFLSNCVIPSVPFYPYFGKEGDFWRTTTTLEEMENWNRYFLPLVAFDVRHTVLHNWREPGISSYLRAEQPLRLNAYVREGEVLITGASMETDMKRAAVAFNARKLELSGKEVFAYDVLSNHLEICPVDKTGWVETKLHNLDNEPVILYLKEKVNDEPQFIWHHHNLKPTSIDCEDSGGHWLVRFKVHIRVLPGEGGTWPLRMYVGKKIMDNSRLRTIWGGDGVNLGLYPKSSSVDVGVRHHALGDWPYWQRSMPLDGPAGSDYENVMYWQKLRFEQRSTKDSRQWGTDVPMPGLPVH